MYIYIYVYTYIYVCTYTCDPKPELFNQGHLLQRGAQLPSTPQPSPAGITPTFWEPQILGNLNLIDYYPPGLQAF